MRKNINKIVTFAIGMSIMSGSIMPTFAAEIKQTGGSSVNVQNQTKQNQIAQSSVLTLKGAIDAAISNSDTLALKSKEINLYKHKADIQEEIDDFQDNDDDYPYDKLELTINQTKDQQEYTTDQIAEDITAKYNNIVSMQNSLSKLKTQIEIQTKENEYATLKKSLGMLTLIDISKTEIELQTLKNSEKSKQDQLKNAVDYFKIITEKDLNNYILEQDQEYNVFRIEGSLDTYFDKVVDKYYKYDNKLIDMTKDNLDDNDVDNPTNDDQPNKDDFETTVENADGTTSQVYDSAGYEAAATKYVNEWNDYGTYLQSKYNLSSSKVSLEENKKNLKKGLKDSYASLISMENDIDVAKSNMDVKNKELSIAKLKYDEGLIIKTDYDKQVLDYADLETELRSSINDYNKLENEIQKPWLLSSESTSS